MQIKFEKLKENLQAKILPFYIIHGEELLFIQDAMRLIQSAAMNKYSFSHCQNFYIDDLFDWQEFNVSQDNLSLFEQNKKLIIIKVLSDKVNNFADNFSKLLAVNKPNQCILIICYKSIDKKQQQKSWFKKLSAQGGIIPIWKITPIIFKSWFLQKCRLYKINLPTSSVDFVCNTLVGNYAIANQILYKIRIYQLYHKSNTIELEQLKLFCSDLANFNIFDLINAYLSNNKKLIYQILQQLQLINEAPILILNFLMKELRHVFNLHNLSPNQYNEYFVNNGIWLQRRNLLLNAVQTITLSKVTSILEKIYVMYNNISNEPADLIWLHLKQMILDLDFVE